MKTYLPNVIEEQRKCYLIDANNKVLGRVAARAAHILRGKHKRTWTPFLDSGDTVIIINADKIRLTGKKSTDEMVLHYTGYQSGLRQIPLGELLAKKPLRVMQLAVKRMLPSGPLANKQVTRLKIYTGQEHPHVAQKPVTVAL